MADEYNYDIVERSWYIEPDQDILGRFSKSFMVKIARLLPTHADEPVGSTGSIETCRGFTPLLPS